MKNNKNDCKKGMRDAIGEIRKYFKVIEDGEGSNDKNILCRLCPNMCIIKEGHSGICSARMNRGGKFYSIVYGYPCGLHIDPIEKKPLYHFYPGEGILSFGTFGCNMFCKGCQNYDMTRMKDPQQKVKELKYYSPEDIVKTALENNIGMIAYTYNEPTIFFEYMLDTAKLAKKAGIKNVIVSNGYINPGPLKELCKYIDAANIDIKGITEKFYEDYSSVHINPVLQTIKILHEKKVWLELTNLVIPRQNDDPKDIKNLCLWIADNIGTDVPLHFSRFYPYYKASNLGITTSDTLEHAKSIALQSGIKYVYIGNLGFLDDTKCSNCKATLIERNKYGIFPSIELHGQKKNKCRCGSILPGKFHK